MRKLLIGIAVQLIMLCGVDAQIPNIIKVYSANSTDTVPLVLVDSIKHLNGGVQVHSGNIKMNYILNSIDSFSYDSIDFNQIPCNFSGYTGQYSTMTDSRDGNVYKTVTIGNQTWMAENLRYDVPSVYTVGATSVDTINPNNPCKSYGRLYDWTTMMNGDTSSAGNPSTAQGICPYGWHIPSDAEWKELEIALGMSQINADNRGWRILNEVYEMKSMSGWSNYENGTNSSGFSTLPAGTSNSGNFFSLGGYAYFWSSTEYSTSFVWHRTLVYSRSMVDRGTSLKNNGFSCRCVEN